MQNNSPSVAAQWIDTTLAAIREELPAPTIITRKLHLISAAMNDAFAAFDRNDDGAYRRLSSKGLNRRDVDEVVANAAYKVACEVLPDHEDLFDDLLEEQGFDKKTKASRKGRKAGRSVLRARKNDGSSDEVDYDYSEYSDNINEWKPLRIPTGNVVNKHGFAVVTDDPDSYTVQKPITPQWGDVDTFVISKGSQFRPPAPPKFGDFSEYTDALGNVSTNDAAFRQQFSDVVRIGAELTPKDKVTAEYWADGPRTSTPPGHWNEIALDLCARDGNTLAEDVKLFHALNAGLMDAGIAAWDAKYAHNFVRPQSAIREMYQKDTIIGWAGPNQGAKEMLGSEWRPYQDVTFVTPAFPEFVSGHSTFSYTAAVILDNFFDSDKFYDGKSRGAHDLDGDGKRDKIGRHVATEMAFEDYEGEPIVLKWDTLYDAAADAGYSRLYGGIHIQDGDLRGREIGEAVGQAVVDTLL